MHLWMKNESVVNLKKKWKFYWSQLEDYIWAYSLSGSSENYTKEAGRTVCIWLGERGTCNQYTACRSYFTHEEEISWLMFLVLSGYGKMQGTGFIESLLKLSKYLRIGSASFPRAQSTWSWPFPWLPFRVDCRSVTAVASDLVLVELCGGQHILSHNPLHFHLNFNQDLGGILTMLPQALGVLIPRLDKDNWKTAQCASTHLVLETVAKILRIACATSLVSSKKYFPLLVSSHT